MQEHPLITSSAPCRPSLTHRQEKLSGIPSARLSGTVPFNTFAKPCAFACFPHPVSDAERAAASDGSRCSRPTAFDELSARHGPRLRIPWDCCFAVRYRALPHGSCCRYRTTEAGTSPPRARILTFHAGRHPSSDASARTQPDLPSHLTTHLRHCSVSTTPVGPVHLARSGIPSVSPALQRRRRQH